MSDSGHIARIRPFRLTLCLGLILLAHVSSVAVAEELIVIGDVKQTYFQSFLAGLSDDADIAKRYGDPVTVDIAGIAALEKRKATSTIVTIGNSAARRIHSLNKSGLIVHALMTEGMLDEFRKENACIECSHAVLLVEQPVERYLVAIKAALPGKSRLGIVYGPQSERHAPQMHMLAQRYGLSLVEKNISEQSELRVALTELLPQVDVLLALPDQMVVNSDTARTLILDTYLHSVALVGYSSSMVKAGALMAIHSTPSQLGKQTASLLLKNKSDASHSGKGYIYPDDFDVSINYQVARVLGISLPDEAVLRQAVMQQGAQ